MSRYGELLRKPPVLTVKGKPREIKIDLEISRCIGRYTEICRDVERYIERSSEI